MKNLDLKKHFFYILIVLIILLGIYLRFRGFWANSSLWCDECALAINIRFKSFLGLFKVLYCLQVAPPLFLIATKFLTNLWGYSERVFRLIPFITGCLSIIAFYFLASKTLNKKISILAALLLFIINQQLIEYSFEFKPYILDVFFTIICLLFFINFDIKKTSFKKTFLYGVLISIIPWFAFTPMFVIGAGVLNLFFKNIKFAPELHSMPDLNLESRVGSLTHHQKADYTLNATRDEFRKIFFFLFPMLMIFLVYANVFLINNYLNSGMISYWGGRENAFLGLNWHSLMLFKNNVKFFLSFNTELHSMHNLPFAVGLASPTYYLMIFVLILVIWGVFNFAKEKQPFIRISAISFVLCIMACALGFYPFFERFVLFLLPMLLIIIAKPLDTISFDKKIKSLIIIVLFLPIIFSQMLTLKDFLALKKISKHGEHPREMMLLMLKNIKFGDRIFINQNSSPSANYYFYYFYPVTRRINYMMNMHEKMTVHDYEKILKRIEKGYWWFYLACDYSQNNIMDKTILDWAKNQKIIKMFKDEKSILMYVYVK